MFKIFIITVLLIVVGTGIAAVSFLLPKNTSTGTTLQSTPRELGDSPASQSSKLVDAINQIIQTPPPLIPGNLKSIEEHTRLLESTIGVLQKRIENLEKLNKVTNPLTASPTPSPTAQPSTTPVKKSPIYIVLGNEITTISQTYTTVDAYGVSLNPADFEGYKNVQLEAFLDVPEVIGTAYARIFNTTDNKDMGGSEVSTKSRDFVLLSSDGFLLDSGKKSYYLQIKSSDGRLINVKNARLRVNF